MLPKYEDSHFIEQNNPVWNYSLFSQEDILLFQQGKHVQLYKLFGNKQFEVLGKLGTYFAVWAPNAVSVSVMGYFNAWQKQTHQLFVRLDNSGIWEGFIPNLNRGEVYKYHIINTNGVALDKADPFSHHAELKPLTGSITWDCFYEWRDADFMNNRYKINSLKSPYTVYEVHLGSWRKPIANKDDSYYSYRELAVALVNYVKELGFTHVEFMPIMEHPFDGSWGYQGSGYFAPTSRFGAPQDFAYLVDAFHQENIGVILDWVPSHFPYDIHGLYMFDGFSTYEYADPRKGFHPDWNSYIFNYGRGEVRSFLLSSAHFWLDIFHADGLRVDAVSSLLRLDYSRKAGQWQPNQFGGNGNIEAIQFVKDLNYFMYQSFKDIQIIAEESTDWPKVSKPLFEDGLGFGMKWMLGWMHDTLDYFKIDPLYRNHHQNKLSFSMMYYYDENFMLPISHDEVVHGKSPMLYKMPGDEWQKFANLRVLYTYMFTHPGGKLLFMGNEFASTSEWNYKMELPWHLIDFVSHGGMKYLIQSLNTLLKSEPALYTNQFEIIGFEWVDLNHRDECIITYKRKHNQDEIYIVLNLTPVNRQDYTLEFNEMKTFKQLLNTDDVCFWGIGTIKNEFIATVEIDQKNYLKLQLPALSALVFKEVKPIQEVKPNLELKPNPDL